MAQDIKMSLQQWFAAKNNITVREARRIVNVLRKSVDTNIFLALMDSYLIYFFGSWSAMVEHDMRQKMMTHTYY